MKRQRTLASRPIPALLFLAILLALTAGVASAHETTVTRSSPASGSTVAESPFQVTAQFSEELDTGGSTMIVVDAAGQQVSDGMGKVDLNDPNHATMIATLPAPLSDGIYTVNWHALLTDGDASEGSFTFTVQTAGSGAMADATASPTVAPAVTPTAAAPTADAAMAAPAAATTATPAAMDATASAPSQLPTTGSSANWAVLWSAAAIGMLIVVTLGAVFQRSRR